MASKHRGVVAIKVCTIKTPIHERFKGYRIRIATTNKASPTGGQSFAQRYLLWESGDYPIGQYEPRYLIKAMKDFEWLNGPTKFIQED